MTWPMVQLRELIATPLANGRSVPSQDGGFPVLRLTALRHGTIDLRERKGGAWNRDDAERFLIEAGDFLVSRGNGSLDLVGRGGLVSANPEPVAFPDTMIRVRPNLEHLDPHYLALAWTSPAVRAQIEESARTTAGIYKINQSHLGSVEIPVPPFDEQRRIVDLLEDHLSRLDAADAYLRAATARASAVLAFALASAFSGQLARLGDLTVMSGYGTSEKCVVRGPGPAVVRIPNFVNGSVDLTDEKRVASPLADVSRSMLEADDVLIVQTNGSTELIGRAAVVQPGVRAAFASYLIRYRVDSQQVLAKWVQAKLSAPQSRALLERLAASSAGQHNLSLSKLDAVLIPVPPLDEQIRRILQAGPRHSRAIGRVTCGFRAR